MRKIIVYSVFLIILMFLAGCDENEDLKGPALNEENEILSKEMYNINTERKNQAKSMDVPKEIETKLDKIVPEISLKKKPEVIISKPQKSIMDLSKSELETFSSGGASDELQMDPFSYMVWRAFSWAWPWGWYSVWMGSLSESFYHPGGEPAPIDYIDVIGYSFADYWLIKIAYDYKNNDSFAVVQDVLTSYYGPHWWVQFGDHYFMENSIVWNPITTAAIYWGDSIGGPGPGDPIEPILPVIN